MEVIPHFFTCPISLELFTDPVTLCTGQTYDRPFIKKWIDSGNATCPVTMQKLHDLSMVPNHTLRHLIDQWLQMVLQFDHTNEHCLSLPSLKHTLQSKDTTLEEKLEALEQVRWLSEDLERNDGLVRLGFLPLLLRMVLGGGEMMGLVERALEIVVKMVPHCGLSHLGMINDECNFESFRALLRYGTTMVKIRMCNLIQVIFNSPSMETKEIASMICSERRLLKEVIYSINDGHEHNLALSEAAIRAISAMLASPSSEGCHERLVELGLLHALLTYILKAERNTEKESNNLGAKATRVIEILLQVKGGKESFLVNGVIQDGVKALVKMVFRVSRDDEEGSESSINSLMVLCLESKEVRDEAISVGILTQLLLLLQSQCCVRVKLRARMLLKLLRSFWT